MRVLIQRVSRAQVTVANEVVGRIGKGLLIFFAVHRNDSEEPLVWLADKIADLRIFADSESKMNLSLKDVGGSALIVSQFTLYGTCTKGRRPEFTQSGHGAMAKALYDRFVMLMTERIPHVATGTFGAHMEIELVNDGPVTLLIDRPESNVVS